MNRDEIVSALEQGGFSLWECLGLLWSDLDTAFDSLNGTTQHMPLAVALAKFERNVIAGSWKNQRAAM